MNAVDERALEDEVERLDCIIKAAEDWSDAYQEDPEGHAALIRLEARYERNLRRLFREKADIVTHYVNWNEYEHKLTADLQVDTIVSGDFFDGIDGDFISVSFDTIAAGITNGAQSGEKIYKIPLGIQTTDAVIQDLTTKQIAGLVGKIVQKDGTIIDNPHPEYKVSDKTRKDVAKSIQTSIALGENRNAAAARLQATIKNPARATDIAQTEMVNAHASGKLEFGRQSGATGKRSRSTGAVDQCAAYSTEGIVPLNHTWGGKQGPAYHPRCRCGLVLDYSGKFDTQTTDAPIIKPNTSDPISIKLPPSPRKQPDSEAVATLKAAVKQYKLTPGELQYAIDTKLTVLTNKVTQAQLRAMGVSKNTLAYYTPTQHAVRVIDTARAGATRSFFHEFGHSLDYRFENNLMTQHNNDVQKAIKSDGLNILIDRVQNMYGPAYTRDIIITMLRGGKDRVKKGETWYVAHFPPKYRRYIMSDKEIFADAYGQYRTQPKKFAEYAPEMTKVFKGLGL